MHWQARRHTTAPLERRCCLLLGEAPADMCKSVYTKSLPLNLCCAGHLLQSRLPRGNELASQDTHHAGGAAFHQPHRLLLFFHSGLGLVSVA